MSFPSLRVKEQPKAGQSQPEPSLRDSKDSSVRSAAGGFALGKGAPGGKWGDHPDSRRRWASGERVLMSSGSSTGFLGRPTFPEPAEQFGIPVGLSRKVSQPKGPEGVPWFGPRARQATPRVSGQPESQQKCGGRIRQRGYLWLEPQVHPVGLRWLHLLT